jgi:P2 phage tail completion protein R (GpR)
VTNVDERSNGITYEIDILNNKTADMSIKLELTENVAVSVGANGKRTVRHMDDATEEWVATW